jgi:hypothetical protein
MFSIVVDLMLHLSTSGVKGGSVLTLLVESLSAMSPDYSDKHEFYGLVMFVREFDAVKVCKHLRKIRFLFRNERYEFLRCEGCGQIVRLPL